jgi:ferric-dicitrate binding protein FerR (iron transport regulator)
MDRSDDVIALLDTYLSGTGTPEERARAEAYVIARPDVRDRLIELRRCLDDDGPAPVAYTTIRASLLERIAREALAEASVPTQTSVGGRPPRSKGWRSGTPRHGWRSVMIPLAGLCAVIVAAVVAKPMLKHRMPSKAVPADMGQVYRTASGQRATVTLPDGSVALLAPKTMLTVHHVSSSGARVVSLVGEAYFTVTPTPRAPLVVQTGAVHTRVLGTQFSVRHYPDDPDVFVTVLSGKVAVTAATRRPSSIVLTANMIGRITDSTATTAVADGASISVDWIHGRLLFRNATVSTVLATLSRWYGYEFHLADSTLAEQQVTTSFDVGRASEMFDGLRWLLHVDVIFSDSVVTLRSAHRVSTPSMRDEQHRGFSTSMEVGR